MPSRSRARRTLTGYARHPNIGGVLVVGLGCEVNQVSALVDQFELAPDIPVERMTIQHLGGTAATIRPGCRPCGSCCRSPRMSGARRNR